MNDISERVGAFDRNAKSYVERLSKYNVEAYREHLDKLIKNMLSDALVLDVACGDGNVSEFIKSQHPNVKIVGFDLSPKLLEMAKEKLPDGEFHEADMKEFDYKKNYYNVIVSSFGVPFLDKKEIKEFFEKIVLSLTNGGLFYLSFMEGDGQKFEKTSFSGEDKICFNYFRQKFIDSILELVGLKVLYFVKQIYTKGENELVDLIYICKKP